uniref:HEAT repeat-containing protein 1 n=1 Tax=Astyanax mexicanus TaxID=7994 RepID=A0A8B9K3U5_ASTMX
MTSLAHQLKRLALPQNAPEVFSRKETASLLFEPKHAATLDRASFYALGCTGLEELLGIESAFEEFQETLFSEASMSLERNVQTKEVNQKLDKSISLFLTRLSPYFLLKPALKCLEWLIHRFHIHLYNQDSLIACALPYHDTKLFVRVIQLFKIEDPTHRWHWLHGLQKPGVPLARGTLLTHCYKDLGFMDFICTMVTKSLKAYSGSVRDGHCAQLRVMFSFYAAAIVPALEAVEKVTDSIVAKLLPYVQLGLKSELVDYKAATYMIVAQLSVKVVMQPELVDSLASQVSRSLSRGPALTTEGLSCLVILLQNQKEGVVGPKPFGYLCAVPSLVPTLQAISASYSISPVLRYLLPHLIHAAVSQNDEQQDQGADRTLHSRLLESVLQMLPLSAGLENTVTTIHSVCVCLCVCLQEGFDESFLKNALLERIKDEAPEVVLSALSALQVIFYFSYRIRQVLFSVLRKISTDFFLKEAVQLLDDPRLSEVSPDLRTQIGWELLPFVLVTNPEESARLQLPLCVSETRLMTQHPLTQGWADVLKDVLQKTPPAAVVGVASQVLISTLSKNLSSMEPSAKRNTVRTPLISAMAWGCRRNIHLFTVYSTHTKFLLNMSNIIHTLPVVTLLLHLNYDGDESTFLPVYEVLGDFLSKLQTDENSEREHGLLLLALLRLFITALKCPESSFKRDRWWNLEKLDESTCCYLQLLCRVFDVVLSGASEGPLASSFRALMQLLLQSVLSILLPAVGRVLEQCSPDTAVFLLDEALFLQLLLGKYNEASAALLSRDARSLELFVTALRVSSRPYEHIPSIQIIALEQITKPFFAALDDEKIQQRIMGVMFDLLVDTKSPAVSQTINSVFKAITVDAELVANELAPVEKPKVSGSVQQTRRSKAQKTQEAVPEESAVSWPRVTLVLELLQHKKKLKRAQILVPTLFSLLSRYDHANMFILIYRRVLFLLAVLIYRDILDEDKFSVELVVQCVRTSDMPQTHHHALLLLGTAAGIFPEKVLHNIMPIFTFMGANIMRLDDTYSFQVISRTVRTVIPALIQAHEAAGSQSEGQMEAVVTRIVHVFVDALPHVPEHRRLPILKQLLDTLGPDRFLWVLMLLLFKQHTALSTAGAEKEAALERDQEFWISLCCEFEVQEQLASLIKILQFLTSLPKDKEEVTDKRRGRGTRGQKKEESTTDLIFSVETHSGKELRHFKFLSVSFMAQLLSSSSFVGKVADCEDLTEKALQNLQQSLLEENLRYIHMVAQCVEENADQPTTKFWRALLNKSYDVLDKVRFSHWRVYTTRAVLASSAGEALALPANHASSFYCDGLLTLSVLEQVTRLDRVAKRLSSCPQLAIRLSSLSSTLATKVPSRVLLPTLAKCYGGMVDSQQNRLGPLMNILREHIGQMEKEQFTSHQSELTSFFLLALDFRSKHCQGDLEKTAEIEGYVIDCLLAMVMKLSEVTFRPLVFTKKIAFQFYCTISFKPFGSQIFFSKVRFSALMMLLELAGKLRENYMVLLPETIPFLAELMEDECEEVEHQVQKVIQEMETILGEPLQSYF